MRLDILQERLPNRESRQVEPVQVTSRNAKQVHEVARTIALLALRELAQLIEKRNTALLDRVACSVAGDQSFQQWRHQQTLLSSAHVVLGLCLQERVRL